VFLDTQAYTLVERLCAFWTDCPLTLRVAFGLNWIEESGDGTWVFAVGFGSMLFGLFLGGFSMACNIPCHYLYLSLLLMFSSKHLRVLETQFVHQFCLGEYAVLFGGSLVCVPDSPLHKQGTVYRTFLIPRHLFDSFLSTLSSWLLDTVRLLRDTGPRAASNALGMWRAGVSSPRTTLKQARCSMVATCWGFLYSVLASFFGISVWFGLRWCLTEAIILMAVAGGMGRFILIVRMGGIGMGWLVRQ